MRDARGTVLDQLEKGDKMKLSIIVPVYNEAPYIKRCLDSIPMSEDIEVIIIDDGSTDGSAEIVKAYDLTKHGINVKVLGHSSNWGLSMTRNHGMSLATGDYITFLDSDDYYTDGAVQAMLEACETHYPIIQFNDNRAQHHNRAGFYDLNRLPKKWVLVWNKIYKAEFLRENRLQFPANVTFEEDRAFNLMCFHYQKEIYHTGKQTVVKCFDNKKSICHTVDKAKLLSSSYALHKLAEEETDIEVLRLIRKCIAELWESKNAYKNFGGMK